MLSALEIEKLNFSSLFVIYFHCYPVLFSTQVSDIGPSWSSCISFEKQIPGIPVKILFQKEKTANLLQFICFGQCSAVEGQISQMKR